MAFPPACFFLLSLLKGTREDPHFHPAECSNKSISDSRAILTTTGLKQGTESSTANIAALPCRRRDLQQSRLLIYDPHPDGTFAGYKSPGGGSRQLRLQLRILKDFIHGFDFVRMAPHNEVIEGGTVRASLSGAPAQAKVTARVLAEPGKAYAVYVLGGNAVELAVKLPAGKYQAEWIDTRTGKSAGAEQFEHAGGTRHLTAPPYTEDIALRILAR